MCVVKRLILLLVTMLSLSGRAEVVHETLAQKEERFFKAGEWGSSAAMLDRMISDTPDDAALYGRAIAVAIARGDTLGPRRLLDDALGRHLPFDSVFRAVERSANLMERSDVYERFLIGVTVDVPWLKRPAIIRLVAYFRQRRDPAKVVEYSLEMLDASPRSVPSLLSLADGYMMLADFDSMVLTLKRLLEIDPHNVTALVTLGNYYLTEPSPDPALAGTYLRRANDIFPTPRLASLLARLELR